MPLAAPARRVPQQVNDGLHALYATLTRLYGDPTGATDNGKGRVYHDMPRNEDRWSAGLGSPGDPIAGEATPVSRGADQRMVGTRPKGGIEIITDGSTVGVIYNPASGGDGACLPEGFLRGPDGFRPEVIVTEEQGDAREVARGWREGLLVVAGGDGTFNEVVNGLGEAGFPEGVTLAVLPAGTGNDCARTLGMPDDPERAWETIRTGRTRTLDVARVRPLGAEERFFVNAAVGGAGAEVSEAADDSNMKARWGSLTYLRASLGVARNLRAHELEIRLDGGRHRLRGVSVVVGNCRYAGGGRLAAPRANPEDGLLDVVVMKYAGLGKILALAPAALTRPDYLDDDGIFFARAEKIGVSAFPPSLKFNSDGEVLGPGPAEFSVVPRVLKTIVGPDYAPAPGRSGEAWGTHSRRNA